MLAVDIRYYTINFLFAVILLIKFVQTFFINASLINIYQHIFYLLYGGSSLSKLYKFPKVLLKNAYISTFLI